MARSTGDKRQPRERALEAAMDAIAELGLARLRMEDVGRRAGMSPGHILYYFRSKQRLLLETLRWSEDRLAEQRAGALAAHPRAVERLRCFVALYLPEAPRQANWMLWLQAWALSVESAEVSQLMSELNERWQRDLRGIVQLGIGRREFASVDVADFAREFQMYLDGLSLHMVADMPPIDHDRAVRLAADLAALRLGFTPGT